MAARPPSGPPRSSGDLLASHGGRGRDRAGRERPLGLGAAERHGDPQGPQAMDALELLELQVLDLPAQVAEVLEVLDVAAVLQRLAGLSVDDRDLTGLGHALGRALDHRLVDPLLDDLVADVVSAIHVEALLVETEPDRERGVLDEDQVRRLKRHREVLRELVRPRGDAAHDHELPEPEILQIQGIEPAVLHQRGTDVDLVIDPVRLLLLEVVREHPLGGLFLEIQVRSEEHTSELQSLAYLVCRLLLEKKKNKTNSYDH